MNIKDKLFFIAKKLQEIYKAMDFIVFIEEKVIFIYDILPTIKKEHFKKANEFFIGRKNYSVIPFYGGINDLYELYDLEINEVRIVIKNEDADVEEIKKDIDKIINKLRSF